ncbi:ATP-binding protein [Streptomyces sp. NPDC090106]|uniref:ATP-binding protein n=1 Tax=Streptomyces sp. NPDC090106 TaxID=3365946 RepID=UPI0037F984E3
MSSPQLRPQPRRASPAHRRKKRRTPGDGFVAEQIRAAVLTPLLIVLAVLVGAVIAWLAFPVSAGALLAALATGLCAALAMGAVRARSTARAVRRAYAGEVQRVVEAATAVDKLVAWSAEELLRGGTVSLPDTAPAPAPGGTGLADEAVAQLAELQVQAVAALMRVHDESQPAVLLSMLHQFARREHALVARALEKLDRLQESTEDPDQLELLFALDHLVTRLRRWVESKAVVAGESLRSAREPVSVMQVLRGANQEILHYARVTVAAGTVGVEVGLPRHVGPDLTHLLAELIENATHFSDSTTKVQVRAQKVATGLAIEIEDRVAIPMRPGDRVRWNRLLAGPDQMDVGALVSAGRIGLLTAARIAQRHGISVQLAENPTGGTTALVVVPARLLVALTPPTTHVSRPAPPTQPDHPSATSAVRVGVEQPATVPQQPAQASAPDGAVAGPPLPRRQVPTQDEAPSPAAPAQIRAAATRPRYGLADAFRGAIATDRTAPTSAPGRPPAAAPVTPARQQ